MAAPVAAVEAELVPLAAVCCLGQVAALCEVGQVRAACSNPLRNGLPPTPHWYVVPERSVTKLFYPSSGSVGFRSPCFAAIFGQL